jgi:hypothetical protein
MRRSRGLGDVYKRQKRDRPRLSRRALLALSRAFARFARHSTPLFGNWKFVFKNAAGRMAERSRWLPRAPGNLARRAVGARAVPLRRSFKGGRERAKWREGSSISPLLKSAKPFSAIRHNASTSHLVLGGARVDGGSDADVAYVAEGPVWWLLFGEGEDGGTRKARG